MSTFSFGSSTDSSSSSSAVSNNDAASTSSESSLSLSSAFGLGANSSNPSGRSSRASCDVCDGAPARAGVPQEQRQIIELYDAAATVATGADLYDVPKNVAASTAATAAPVYDVPPSLAAYNKTDAADVYDTPPPFSGRQGAAGAVAAAKNLLSARDVASQETTYDVPPSMVAFRPVYDGSAAHDVTYDSPKPQPPQRVFRVVPPANASSPLAGNAAAAANNINNQTAKRSLDGMADIKASLPLELDAAMETLVRLGQEVTSSLSHLSALWNGVGRVQPTELQLRCMRLKSSLQELVDFAKAAAGNASRLKSGDDQVAIRLVRLLRPLCDANCIVQKTTSGGSQAAWRGPPPPAAGPADQLDQLKACCQNLVHDVRLVS